MKVNKIIWLDDIRRPLPIDGFDIIWVKTYDEFVKVLTNTDPNTINLISLDHDLSDEHMKDYYKNQANGFKVVEYDSFNEKTGLDCAKWLLDNPSFKLSRLNTINIHSHNPVGTQNIYDLFIGAGIKPMRERNILKYTVYDESD